MFNIFSILGLEVQFLFNTLRSRQNGCHFADDIFKGIFLNENVQILLKISLWFVYWRIYASLSLNELRGGNMNSVVRLPNIFQDVVNSLRPCYIHLLTLAQVIAWHLTAPSHYLSQHWLNISEVLRHSSEGNFIRYTPKPSITWKLLIWHSIQIFQGPMC